MGRCEMYQSTNTMVIYLGLSFIENSCKEAPNGNYFWFSILNDSTLPYYVTKSNQTNQRAAQKNILFKIQVKFVELQYAKKVLIIL